MRGSDERADAGSAIETRARWRALLTETVVVPRRAALSRAVKPNPSRSRQRRQLAGREALVGRGERVLERIALVRLLAGVRRLRVAGRRPPPAPVDLVEAGVGRDRVEPRAQRGATLKAAERPPRAQHHLLQGVLGVVIGAQHAPAMGVELGAIGLEQGGERMAVAGARRLDQRSASPHASDPRRRSVRVGR